MKPEIDWAKFRWDHLPTDEEVWEVIDALFPEPIVCAKCGEKCADNIENRIRKERFHIEWSMPELRACGFAWEDSVKYFCKNCDFETRDSAAEEEERRGKPVLVPSGRCMCMNNIWPDEVEAVKAKHEELYAHDEKHELRINAGLI